MLVKVLLLVCVAVVANANQKLWSEFKVTYNKNYVNEIEHQLRYNVFNNNLQNIKEHNDKYDQGLVTWYKAVNQFTDLTQEEFRQILNAQVVNQTKTTNAQKHVAALEIPDSIDWRNYGYVTGVKNQGSCGACWTFSATGTLEGQYARKNGALVSLSEQNVMDCATENSGYSGDGCSGGVVQSGLDYVRDHGIATEDSYPYEGYQDSCRNNGNVFQISGYTEIGWNDENDLKNAVGSVGPVSIALNADKFQSYGGGIFNDQSCSTSIDHGVLVVGYGSENNQDYWIVKNSWGASWGEAGYIRMAIGYNLCALASQACYPNL